MNLNELGATQAPVNEQAELPTVNTAGRYEPTEGVTPRGTTGYSRKVPWGTAKHVVSHKKLTKYRSVREALVQEGMDWNVEKVPLHTLWHPNVEMEVEGFQAVRRADNGRTLGVVKGRYTPMQNRRLAEFTDTLVQVDGEAAALGESFGGRKVWSVIKLDDIDSPDGGLGTFLVASNSHDGSSSMSVTFVTVRWACTNGLIALANKSVHTVKIRHTSTMEMRLEEAHRVLAESTNYVEDTSRIMNELLNTPIGNFNQLINGLMPIPAPTKDNKRAVQNAEKRQAEVHRVLFSSDNLADVRMTGWGFVNAVAEWNEWEGSHVRRRQLSPMERLLNDSSQDIVHRARDLVLA